MKAIRPSQDSFASRAASCKIGANRIQFIPPTHKIDCKSSLMNPLIHIFCATMAVLASFGPAALTRAGETDQPSSFVVDATDYPPTGTPTVRPWRSITLDPEYAGQWVVLGDVDGDRKVEIVSARNLDKNDNHFTSAVVAQKLDGTVLWKWGDAKIGRRNLHHDVACQIHDLDHDGTNEVVLAADRELVVLAGKTGKPVRSFPIPDHASDCVVFADLSGKGWPSDILVKNRYQQIWAYTTEGELLWTVAMPGGYRTAHQPFPVDLDGDGHDEILAGYAAVNADGSIRWVFEAEQGKKNGGHADCWRVVRLAKKAEDTRLVMTMCSGNTLVLTDGNGKVIWRQAGHHFESVDVGEIREDCPGLEIVVDIDHLPKPPKPLCLFDEQGTELGRINTDHTRQHTLVDWDGDGLAEIGSALPQSLFDGYGRRVVTFAVEEGEKPWLMMAVDLTGHGMRDVMLTTSRGDTYRVYLYKNPAPVSGSTGCPAGTGVNFTLY